MQPGAMAGIPKPYLLPKIHPNLMHTPCKGWLTAPVLICFPRQSRPHTACTHPRSQIKNPRRRTDWALSMVFPHSERMKTSSCGAQLFAGAIRLRRTRSNLKSNRRLIRRIPISGAPAWRKNSKRRMSFPSEGHGSPSAQKTRPCSSRQRPSLAGSQIISADRLDATRTRGQR